MSCGGGIYDIIIKKCKEIAKNVIIVSVNPEP